MMTKLAPHLAEQLTDIVTDAVLTIHQPEQPLDLYMVRQGHCYVSRAQGVRSSERSSSKPQCMLPMSKL